MGALDAVETDLLPQGIHAAGVPLAEVVVRMGDRHHGSQPSDRRVPPPPRVGYGGAAPSSFALARNPANSASPGNPAGFEEVAAQGVPLHLREPVAVDDTGRTVGPCEVHEAVLVDCRNPARAGPLTIARPVSIRHSR